MAIDIGIMDPVGPISVTNFTIDGADDELKEVTLKEINLAESLLTPGLQTSVTMQSYIYTPKTKIFEKFKGKTVSFQLTRTDNERVKGGTGADMDISQTVYRMENREFRPINTGQTEEFTLHICDPSLLKDAAGLISKSWKCTKPSDIVDHVLGECMKVPKKTVDKADPARDYIAENIHPFQVISQQSNVALYQGDPSFLHYMTYEERGTHYFRSVKKMTEEKSVKTYTYAETGIDFSKLEGGGYQNKDAIISMKFPCDFDALADALNGINDQGQDKNTEVTNNPTQKTFTQQGNDSKGCGMGGYNYKTAITNKGSAEAQNSCEMDVETHLLKRQARMALLERDKIALRLLIPWNPGLHVGNVITLEWQNKNAGDKCYGSGDYLILHLNHTIRFGGFSTTTLDCVSKSVGSGAT